MADINEKLDFIIAELRGCRDDLAEDNDRAEWEAEQREKLDRAMQINAHVWKNAPRVVRDYANDTVSVYEAHCRSGRG